MSLKIKIAFLVCLTLLGLSSVEFVGSHVLLEQSVQRAEEEAGRQGADAARSAMDQLAAQLRALAYDYGCWDETAGYLATRDPRYLASNFPEGQPLPPGVDFLLILGRGEEVVFAVARDSETGASIRPPLDAGARFPLPALLSAADTAGRAVDGLVRFPRLIGLTSVYAVRPAGSTSPPHGFMVFGREVGPRLVDRLTQMTRLAPAIAPWSEADRLGLDPEARTVAEGDAGMALCASNSDTLSVFVRLDDAGGEPILALRLSRERVVHRQAAFTRRYFLISLVAVTVAAGLTTLFFLRRILLGRLFRLQADLQRIGRGRAATGRVRVEGHDELTLVATRVNRMLASLESAQARVEEARDQALRATQAKSDFLTNMSHELRTPMNGVIGFANILLDRGLPPMEREMVEGILGSAKHLLHLLNDLLDLSRIEAGRLELQPAPFRLRELIEEIAALHAFQATERGLELITRVHCEAPDALIGDAGRLRQILSNLVGNAIKYTERGRVTLEVWAIDEPPAEHPAVVRLEFRVRDTGIGIARDRLSSIFGRFDRGDPEVARRTGGIGLGLPICQELVTMMQGSVHAWSRQRRGSRFRVRIDLPVAKTERALPSPQDLSTTPVIPDAPGTPDDRSPGPASTPWGARVPRVLVADDNALNRRVAGLMLTRFGCHVETAVDGIDAVRKATEGSFDLILMDCLMPGKDGPEAAREIRALGDRRHAGPPIVALSALTPEHFEELRDEGAFDAFLGKPVEPEALRSLLERFLGRPEAPPPTEQAASGPDPDPELVRLFLMEAPERADGLVRAAAADDPDRMRSEAHALKGMVALLDLTELTDICQAIESAGREKKTEEARCHLDRLGPLLHALIEGLRRQTDQDDKGPRQAAA